MPEAVQPSDLSFFSTLAASGSLSAAARELGLTAAAISKHLTQMERRAGVALVNRTTRRMTLTPEGEIGPYFTDDSATAYNRSDIRSNLDGSSTQSGITVGPQGGTLRYNGGATWTLVAAITGQGGVNQRRCGRSGPVTGGSVGAGVGVGTSVGTAVGGRATIGAFGADVGAAVGEHPRFDKPPDVEIDVPELVEAH